MHAAVNPALLEIGPGETCSLSVRVTNATSTIDAYSVSVFGLDPDWVTVSTPRLSLFPNEAGEVDVAIELPASFPAGHRQLSVHVRSENDPSAFTLTPLGLVALGQPRLTARVDPSIVYGGSEATFGLLLHNEGNTVVTANVAVVDPEEKLDTLVDPAVLEIDPGHQTVVQARVSGDRPWFGQPRVRTLTFVVDSTTKVEALGTFVQKPRVSRWVLSLMGLFAAAAVFAAVLSRTFDNVVDEAGVDDKVLSQALDNEKGDAAGQALVPINPASVTGQVKLQSTGAGVAGVQVELFDSGNTKVPLATAATTTEGKYTFGRLNEGKYKIRLSGAGFNEIWYENGDTAAEATEIEVEASKPKELEPVVLGGRPGSVRGSVEAADLTGIKATLVVPGTISDDEDAEVLSIDVSADGKFIFESVPSPATYDLIIEKAGYATERRTVFVGPAADVENIEVVLRKGDGQISGMAVDANGPIGGVKIDATDGTVKLATVSLTDGTVGQFTLRALTTPQIYTLTISKDGYTPETRTVTLTAAQELDIGNVVLSPSTGSVAGTVSHIDSGPIGGVEVSISTADKTITTFTASSGDIGTFFVDELPIPATYTITFSKPGLVSQVRVQDLDPQTGITDATGIDVALINESGIVQGIVRGPDNTPIAGATVVLSDGTTSRTLMTANDPLGRFRFSSVEPGDYTLTASLPGSTQAVELVNVVSNENIDRDIRLAAQASATGQVLVLTESNPNYVPFAGAVVRLFLPGNFPGPANSAVASTTTDTNGFYTFTALEAPQNYVVAVYTNVTSPDPLDSQLILTQPSTQLTVPTFQIPVLF